MSWNAYIETTHVGSFMVYRVISLALMHLKNDTNYNNGKPYFEALVSHQRAILVDDINWRKYSFREDERLFWVSGGCCVIRSISFIGILHVSGNSN